jgi:PAS domain-containing protein
MAQAAGDVAPWGYDLDIGEVRWTKQLYRQLGYDPAEITPSLSAFRERVHPEDQVRLDDIRKKQRKAEPGSQFQIEVRLVRRNGNLSWIEMIGRGDVWTWTAIVADTKLIISWAVGDRDAPAAFSAGGDGVRTPEYPERGPALAVFTALVHGILGPTAGMR